MDIKVDVRNLQGDLKADMSRYSQKAIASATSLAINKTIRNARAESSSVIRNVYNINNSQLKNALKYKNSTAEDLVAAVSGRRSPLSLSNFSPRHEYKSGGSSFAVRVRSTKDGLSKSIKKSKGAPKKGVSVEIFKNTRVTIPYAFMTKNNVQNPVFARGSYKQGGSYGLVRRNKRINKNGSDLPIAKLLTVSVAGMLSNEKVLSAVNSRINREYIKELDNQINRLK